MDDGVWSPTLSDHNDQALLHGCPISSTARCETDITGHSGGQGVTLAATLHYLGAANCTLLDYTSVMAIVQHKVN